MMFSKHGYSQWLSAGIICLLICGTFAAKTVFLVDNELENKTKFSGKNWQLDLESARKYASKIERIACQYLDRLMH